MPRDTQEQQHKARALEDDIRGKKAKEASVLLEFTNRRAARTLQKVLASAMANAENNALGLQAEQLQSRMAVLQSRSQQ